MLTTEEIMAYTRICNLDDDNEGGSGLFVPESVGITFVPIAPQLYPFALGLDTGPLPKARITDLVDPGLYKDKDNHQPCEELFDEGLVSWEVYKGRKATSQEKELQPFMHFMGWVLSAACVPLLERAYKPESGVACISRKGGYAYKVLDRACKACGYRMKDFHLMEGHKKGTLIGEAGRSPMGRVEGYLSTLIESLQEG
jgi:hypothetical protein